ncbi:EAL domain-containing protein [Gallaecimonas kandeliae]|uniref:EAL domain-containing protein n=1 Tax=Gallaecimonas kandeliae TaxID=3029055 RepID=UPI0026494217|nr:EAL domain-containing protein [Gallaecimonas kandeliae]WKE64175.1 EAL domain-containing protein [Gallaecimonas kandeliae]
MWRKAITITIHFALALCVFNMPQAWSSTSSPPAFYTYKKVSKEDSLPQVTVFDIAKDNEGFFWLATAGGLSRYDGSNITNYLPGSELFPLQSAFIRNITVDKSGKIWVGTQGGLLKKEKDRSVFTIVNAFKGKTIWSVTPISDKEILVGTTEMLYLYFPEKEKIESHYPLAQVKSVEPYKSEYLIGTYADGFFTATNHWSNFQNTKEFGSNINKIKTTTDGYFVASEGGFYFSNKNGTHRLSKQKTHDFLQEGDGSYVLATDNGTFVLQDSKEILLQSGKSWSLFKDGSDLYIGTHTSGLFVLKQIKPGVMNHILDNTDGYYIKSLANVGNLLFFLDNNGYHSQNLQTGDITDLDDSGVIRIFPGDNGFLAITKAGFYLFRDGKITEKYVKDDINFAKFDSGYWLLSDKNNNIYKIINSKLISISSLEKCNPGYINSVNLTSENIYVAGAEGLCRKNLKSGFEDKIDGNWTKRIHNYKDAIYAVQKDGSLLDIKSKGSFKIKLKPGEEIYSSELITRPVGDIFLVVTSLGFRFYEIGKNLLDLNRYALIDSRYNGLQEYTSTAITVLDQDTVLLGGTGGYTQVWLPALQKDNLSGTLTISDLKIFGDERFDLLDKLNQDREITVPYHAYPLSIGLSFVNTPFPDRAEIEYQLSSFDNHWYELDSSNKLVLSKMESGSHHLIFRAVDNGQVIAQSDPIIIQVLPPWWRSNIAIGFYAFLLFFIAAHISSIVRTRRRQHAKIVKSEERLKLALWGSGDELWDWDIEKGNIYRSNIWDSLQLPDDGVRSLDNRNNIYPKDLPRVTSVLNACFSGEQDEFEIAYRVKGKDEDWIWLLDRGRVVEYNEKGAPIRMTGTIKNISKLKKTEEMLKLLAQSFRNISDAICITSPDFVIQEINESFTRITGLSRDEAIGKPWNFSLYSDSFLEQIKTTLDKSGRWHDELEAKRKDGDYYPIEITIDRVMDEEKDSYHFVAVFSDISERKEKERELERLTNTDPLTSLPNRSFFMTTLATLVRRKQPFALLVLDLNNFKQVNDSLGHQYGDQLLIEIADRLQYVLGTNHALYRLGGDEFAIIIDNLGKLEEVTRLSGLLHRQLFAPFYLRGEEINMTSAIGAVLYPEDGDNPENLLRNADAAMYHAKHVGGDICQFFSSTMNEQAHARLALENRVRKGLRENLFEVFYQPKADTFSGQCKGAEALLRLPDGKGGYISPADFIPIAEESGLILDLGAWVLNASCQQVKKWYDHGLFPGRIAINLSARQFRQQDLVARIDEVLENCGLPPHMLELEITEGAMMEDPIRAIAVMERLRERGITLAMDDFGTGYSSLSHLRQFPVTSVKIDRSFVKDLTVDSSARSLTAAIISLAKNMELHVVAEGVETEEQLLALRNLNCPVCQGFLFGKPMAAMDFEQLLIKRGGKLGPAEVVRLKR